jgi:hypothetical protein
VTQLLTSADLRSPALPEWVRQAYEQYRQVILDPEFPCYFGTRAEQQGHMRYAYAEHDRDRSLPAALAEFVEFSRTHPKRRHVFIMFLPTDTGAPDGFARHERRFWDLLQWLHDNDPRPWPADVPRDTDDPAWEFCFAGDPMFAFPCIPAYRRRQSRRMGEHLIICFQPRRVFFGVNRDDPGGERVRADIYARVERWDGVRPHPELVNLAYGDPAMREWKQYVLPDANTPLPSRCPLHTGDRS